MKLKKEQIEAIEESIKHWKRMIRWVKKQDKDDLVSQYTMGDDIKEVWSSSDCALCAIFEVNCSNCPLGIRYGSCGFGSKNAWIEVTQSDRWGEWLINAKVMLKQLKSLLDGK